VAKSSNGSLETAMALLIQNQAAFVSNRQRHEDEFTAIKREFDQIKAILIRHERILMDLPEAIRQKVGFKSH
jgi:hypothetical protein